MSRALTERQKDHLPGGIYHRLSEEQKAAAANVPSHNRASESDFAILDMLVRMKPNANIETLEMITMWYRNRTGDWLYQKNAEEKEKLMAIARSKVEDAKKRLKEKKAKLMEKKQKMLLEKQELTRLANEKRARKHMKHTCDPRLSARRLKPSE